MSRQRTRGSSQPQKATLQRSPSEPSQKQHLLSAQALEPTELSGRTSLNCRRFLRNSFLPYIHCLGLPSQTNVESGVEILQQSDDISDHYLVLCKLHIAKTVNSTPCYKYGRTITSSTKDCFVSNLPDLSQFLSISNSSEQLDDVTETMDSLFPAL